MKAYFDGKLIGETITNHRSTHEETIDRIVSCLGKLDDLYKTEEYVYMDDEGKYCIDYEAIEVK